MDEFEKGENFEECATILKAINRINPLCSLETRYSNHTIPNLKQELNRMGFAGDITTQNMQYYVNKVKEMTK